ncbi:MAG: glycosyltransferase family 4 protein [Verrucomicrobia bacterium]|nr:glycosyltransferase family 4 protein [Verrucomicrobiota bacterium]
MSERILQVFNRYLSPGGEEKSVDRIHNHLAARHEMSRCFFDSAEWRAAGGPDAFGQARRLFYNTEARQRFEAALDSSSADVALLHNIFPVGSPSLYHAALQRGKPLVQFLHNFRPFSVGGTLFVKGRLCPDSLIGSPWAEVRGGAWQGSVVKSALFALMLQMLHGSGWLKSVKAWVAISDFMRDRLVQSGCVAPDRIHTLRHSWDAMSSLPEVEDAGYYLFLGRLVAEKGVVPLLDAWDLLRTRLGPKTPLLHIAGEGPLDSAVRERMRTNPYIGQLGQIGGETKREALRRCRAVIVPSTWWEPLGLVVYEAYDYGKPVLAAKSGGLTEIVPHGVTGLQHEPGDVNGLVNDVLEMEATPAGARQAIGHAGRQWLLREADPQAWMRRFEEILAGAMRTEG